MKTPVLLNKVNEEKMISEKEILLLRRRLNHGEKIDTSVLYDGDIMITEEQTKKGIDFLKNLLYTPKGKERSNHKFGHREKDAINSFQYFEFEGFQNDGNSYRDDFCPIYCCVGTEGSFSYFYNKGEIQVIG